MGEVGEEHVKMWTVRNSGQQAALSQPIFPYSAGLQSEQIGEIKLGIQLTECLCRQPIPFGTFIALSRTGKYFPGVPIERHQQ